MKYKPKSYLNKRTKKVLSVSVIILGIFILSFFKITLNSEILFPIFYISFFILAFGFEEDLTQIVTWGLFVVFLFSLIAIVFFWLFGLPIPFFKITLTDSSIVAIFTIVLATTGIASAIIYKRSVDLQRLPFLDIFMDEYFIIHIKNNSNFPARNINLDVEMIERRPLTNKPLFIQNIKDRTINVLENRISYLSPGEIVDLNLADSITDRFNLSKKEGDIVTTNNRLVCFKVILSVTFYSDQLAKNTSPISRSFKIEINDKGSKIIR
jgi:hypothetical protein